MAPLARWLAEQVRRRHLALVAPSAVYLAIRFTGVLVLGLMSARHGRPVADVLSCWDGAWYLALAEYGAAAGLPDTMLDGARKRTTDTGLALCRLKPVRLAGQSNDSRVRLCRRATGMAMTGQVMITGFGVTARHGIGSPA